MTKCREILTPKQVVKLLLWIDANSDTLGTVCPGWGSEQFQRKPAAAVPTNNLSSSGTNQTSTTTGGGTAAPPAV